MRVAGGLAVLGLGVAVVLPQPADAQDWTRREFPLAPPNAVGNFVAPYFDGYHPNEDGTITFSFGFMNRNDEELIEIPIGPNNFIEPAEFNGNQPTSFPVVAYGGFGGPRERGTFAVVVPGDFEGDVWWTLTTGDYTTRVPGRANSPGPVIKGAYELSTGAMAAGSLRPLLRFSEDGPDIIGIGGGEHPEQFTTTVGEPIDVQFWAFDRGERDLGEVNVTLWKHQGPEGAVIAFESLTSAPLPPTEGRGGAAEAGGRGAAAAAAARARGRGTLREPGTVAVARQSIRIPSDGPAPNMGHIRATFDTPGDYMIRIRVDNFTARDSTAGNQCCWTNGYVRVQVTG